MYSGIEHVKYCDVKRTAEMSSHAPRNKLLNLIKTFPYTKSIIINHGDEETKRKFREYLLDNLALPEEEIVVSSPDIGYRIEPNGIVEQFVSNIEMLI